MNVPIVYDKAKYHFETANPETKEPYVHTGMFLGWVMDHNLFSEFFGEESKSAIEDFKKRKVTGVDVYMEWDGALVDDMLNEEGNAFAQHYFHFDKGKFASDYAKLFNAGDPNFFKVTDTWDNYEKLKKVIDKR